MNRIFFSTLAFATGMIAGLLFSPKTGKGNREWINQNAKEASDWLDKKSRDAIQRSEETLQQFTKKVKGRS